MNRAILYANFLGIILIIHTCLAIISNESIGMQELAYRTSTQKKYEQYKELQSNIQNRFALLPNELLLEIMAKNIDASTPETFVETLHTALKQARTSKPFRDLLHDPYLLIKVLEKSSIRGQIRRLNFLSNAFNHAVLKKYTGVVKVLLRFKAQYPEHINLDYVKDEAGGLTPFMQAAKLGYKQIVDTLLTFAGQHPGNIDLSYANQAASITALILAAAFNRTDIVKSMLAFEGKHPDSIGINQATNKGESAIITAAIHGNSGIVEALLDFAEQNPNNLVIDGVDNMGRTALMAAAEGKYAGFGEKNHAAVLDKLLDFEARHPGSIGLKKVRMLGMLPWGVLTHLAALGHQDAVQKLLTLGKAQEGLFPLQDGTFAIMQAEIAKHMGIVELLLSFEKEHPGSLALDFDGSNDGAMIRQLKLLTKKQIKNKFPQLYQQVIEKKD